MASAILITTSQELAEKVEKKNAQLQEVIENGQL